MSQNFKNKALPWLIAALALIVAVKLIWVIVAYIFLPEKGINIESGQIKNTLHYRYRLASDVALAKVPTTIPTKKAPSIRDIKLVGIYSGKNNSIVTLIKKGKSHILSTGDDIDGFVLKGASAREAYFEKNNKDYTLKLFEEKQKHNSSISSTRNGNPVSSASKDTSAGEVSVRDGIRQVPRSMLKDYTTNIDKAMRDIGLRPVRKGNQMSGYKVRFIRKGSPFSKLGLERGDIIKSINGEEIVDFNAPMSILKGVDTIEGLTITVVRKNEEKELEYEVK
ncbi:MAG: hypothetical protein HF962_03315 [Sulfurovum sp.]|nr:hypothetical protein [Sulfurovum sp.]